MSYRSDKDSFAMRRERKIHPIWQILGWIWIVLIIIISASGARVVSQANRANGWVGLGEGMYNTVRLPALTELPTPMDFNLLISWIPGYPFYYDELVLFIAFMFFGVGIFSMLYAFMYSRIIPVRSPLEAPEVEAERRKPRR